MAFSNEARRIMGFMITELSSLKYGYRDIVEGCYQTAITNCGYDKPTESMLVIIDEVIRILNED